MSDAVATGHIPVIDLSPSFSGEDGPMSVAEEIGAACESLGFLIVTGHGVPSATITAMVKTAEAFFVQPVETRVVSMPSSPYVFRGYFPSEASALAASLDIETPGDLCEVYCINRFDDQADAAEAGLKPGREAFFAPNIWPEGIDGFKPAWTAYYAAMENLTRHILGLMARSLGLPADWFVPFCNQHTTNLVANYYPPQTDRPLAGQLRRGAHTDYSSLSILYQTHDSGGLQVQLGDGTWLDVPYLEDSFVINLGDLLAVWTNERWVSTMHRVVNPPRAMATDSRLSTVFFHQPNYDALIECIPTCLSPQNPARHPPTTSGEWILAKLEKTVG
ncbi:MAG: oxidoreductase [Acidobacteria bacterium]|nr:oxidoreductase [Acidobacteriota bacterium]